MRVVYIGTKLVKGDNVGATGLTWTPGQIHEIVDEKKALKLLDHPLVWADAAKPYQLLKELQPVPAVPAVKVMTDDPYVDPYIIHAPAEIVKQLHAKTLDVVFMKPEDADAFGEWKLDRDTAPDTAPKQTGPATGKKAGLESAGKKVA